jgi:hypothetical protein
MPPNTQHAIPDDVAAELTPLGAAEALARTGQEACRQHERLARLVALGVHPEELGAAHAMVDTIDLALAEAVRTFESACRRGTISEHAEERQGANALWLAAREYLRRHSITERASRQLGAHGLDTLGDLHTGYELEASAMLALRHATTAFAKLRPDARA